MPTIHLPRHALVLAACTLLLHGCGGSPGSSSTDGPQDGPVPTSRMALDLKVESRQPGEVVVRANINDGRTLRRSYRLDGGDYLRACAIGTCRNMADNNSVYEPDYIARFDYRPGVDYVVSFNRLEAQSAPDSHASLPPEFYITTPANRQQVTDGDTVVVSWTPSGAGARVSLSHDAECDVPGSAALFSSGFIGVDQDGDGVMAVDMDSLLEPLLRTPPRPNRCSIDLIVEHETSGRVDPAFSKGSAVGVVSRKVNLDYIPSR